MPSLAQCDLPPDAAARWIVFDSDLDTPNRDLYAVRADGSDVVRLTSEPSTEREAAFSHDGTRLAFASDRAGSMQVYVMVLATQGLTQVTSMSGGADQPSWSTDDAELVFHSDNSVYRMPLGGQPALIVAGPDELTGYSHASFSPDGSEVLCDRYNEIDAISIDGGGQRYVVQNSTVKQTTPSLSPDGTNVVFALACYDVFQLAVIPLANYAFDPCMVPRITDKASGSARNPDWGPADTFAFEHAVGPDPSLEPTSIAVMAGAGATPCDLVVAPGDHRDPVWAPVDFSPR